MTNEKAIHNLACFCLGTNILSQTENYVIKSAHLIGHIDADSNRMRGTCFFIRYNEKDYLVTAAHVLHNPSNNQPIDIYFKGFLDNGDLFNPKNLNEKITCYRHDNNIVDLAIMPFKSPTNKRVWLAPEHHQIYPQTEMLIFGYPLDDLNIQQPVTSCCSSKGKT